jgi:hypothetical protein
MDVGEAGGVPQSVWAGCMQFSSLLNCKKLQMKQAVLGAASGHSISGKFCQSDITDGIPKLRFFLFTAFICNNTRVPKCKQKYLFRRGTASILCCLLTI